MWSDLLTDLDRYQQSPELREALELWKKSAAVI